MQPSCWGNLCSTHTLQVLGSKNEPQAVKIALHPNCVVLYCIALVTYLSAQCMSCPLHGSLRSRDLPGVCRYMHISTHLIQQPEVSAHASFSDDTRYTLGVSLRIHTRCPAYHSQALHAIRPKPRMKHDMHRAVAHNTLEVNTKIRSCYGWSVALHPLIDSTTGGLSAAPAWETQASPAGPLQQQLAASPRW